MRYGEVLRPTWSARTQAVAPLGRSGSMMRSHSPWSSTIGIVIRYPNQSPTVPISWPPGASKVGISPYGVASGVDTGTTGGGPLVVEVVEVDVVVVTGGAASAGSGSRARSTTTATETATSAPA